ncbi:hypothetical protein J6590_084850 [Homalodisca vitripennis]|nr:hypothetical protein J6590_084850 [Homalodisca vitripennis]
MDHRSISEYLEEIPSDSDCEKSDYTDEDLTWYPPKKTSKRDMITLFLCSSSDESENEELPVKNLVGLHTKSNIEKHAINNSPNSRCAIPKKTYSRQSKMGKSNETNSPRVLDELLLDSQLLLEVNTAKAFPTTNSVEIRAHKPYVDKCIRNASASHMPVHSSMKRCARCSTKQKPVRSTWTCSKCNVQRLSPDNLIKQRRPWLLLGQVTAEQYCPSSLSARPLVVVQKSPLSRWSPS